MPTWCYGCSGHSNAGRTAAEKLALRITGYGFYALVAGLVVSAAVNVWMGHRPETTG